MAPGRLILLGLLGLVVAEAAVFLAAARLLGWFGALFTLFATSVFGFLVLGRMGRRLIARLADMLSRRDLMMVEGGSSGVLTALGGILLVLPGFLTDIVGALLLIPAIQNRLLDRPAGVRPRPDGRVLDLDPSQWRDMPNRQIEEDNRPDDDRNRRR